MLGMDVLKFVGWLSGFSISRIDLNLKYLSNPGNKFEREIKISDKSFDSIKRLKNKKKRSKNKTQKEKRS